MTRPAVSLSRDSVVATLLGLLLLPASGTANPLTFTGSSGSRSASVAFDLDTVHAWLYVTLVNTSTADTLAPSDVLTAVFFDLLGNPTLSRLSARIADASTVLYCTPPDCVDPADDNIGGEWAYLRSSGGLSSSVSQHQGMSSAGFGVFGPSDRFPGFNLSGPDSPDGVQWGLVTAGDNPATENGGVLSNALIRNAAVFVLGSLPQGFSLADISNVRFQYGTDLCEPHFPGDFVVPEPASLALLGAGLVACLARRLKRRK